MANITNSTELANAALTRLGEDGIAAITDPDDKSTLVRQQYEISRTKCLTRRTWRFALTKKRISKLSADPVNEYANKFQLPADLLSGPIAVYDSARQGATPMHDWELFGNEILTDRETIVLDYLTDVTDVVRWPPYFQELVILDLAAMLAAEITDSDALTQEFFARAWGTRQENYVGGWYRVAARRDAGTSTPLAFETDTLVNARFGGY